MTTMPDSDTIRRELASAGHHNVVVHAFETLASTSVWLRERDRKPAVQAPSADYVSEVSLPATQLCVTDWQSAGIARRGRTWQTKPGNITFSMLSHTSKSTKDLLGLSLVTGIGVANALSDYAGVEVQLKWPNDIVLADAKLGGLLTEIFAGSSEQTGQGGSQILTGIGINYLHDEEVLSLGIGATSLQSAGVAVKRDLLLGKLAASVLSSHQLFYAEGWCAFAERWRTLDWLMDKNVDLHGEQGTEQAIARGVNDHGALLVERAGGTLPLYSGNVSVRPT